MYRNAKFLCTNNEFLGRTETTNEFVWFYKIIFFFSINKFNNCV